MSASAAGRRQSIYGIWRVDHDKSRTHCWIVRIQRRQRVWRRSFADGLYGGKSKALQAARAFRDEILSLHPPMTRAEYASIKRRNNRSGVPGVCRHVAVEMVSGKPIERAYWIAFWMTRDGRSARRKFSVAKHGEKKAYQRAKAARVDALAAMDGLYATSRGLKGWLRRHTPAPEA